MAIVAPSDVRLQCAPSSCSATLVSAGSQAGGGVAIALESSATAGETRVECVVTPPVMSPVVVRSLRGRTGASRGSLACRLATASLLAVLMSVELVLRAHDGPAQVDRAQVDPRSKPLLADAAAGAPRAPRRAYTEAPLRPRSKPLLADATLLTPVGHPRYLGCYRSNSSRRNPEDYRHNPRWDPLDLAGEERVCEDQSEDYGDRRGHGRDTFMPCSMTWMPG